VIFVHGISASIIQGDYAASFADLLRDRLKALTAVGGVDAAEAVTFERVDYSTIGQAAEERVLAAYDKERGRLFTVPDKLLDMVAFDSLRRQMITSVSDVLVYESARWRDEIRGLLVAKIDPYIDSRDSVSIVGHSLGSVVAFDTAYYNSRHNPAWLKAGFRPTNLFTMGSPIALFSLELDDQSGEQKPRYLPAGAVPPDLDPGKTNADLQPNLLEGVWYNFVDAQDLIAYPLRELFQGKFEVDDIPVQTGTFPINAHTGYWESHHVADRIADRLKRDFARINTGVEARP
jgi:pimeloyl-ACP methyl ester carboxylesterase